MTSPLQRRISRHVNRFADGAADEWLRRRHHANVRIDGDIPLTNPATAVGTIEDRKVFSFEMWGPFHRHRPTAIIIGGGDFFLCKSQRFQHVEVGFTQLRIGQSQLLRQKVLTQRILIKRKLNLEGLGQTAFHSRERGVVEPFLSAGSHG